MNKSIFLVNMTNLVVIGLLINVAQYVCW